MYFALLIHTDPTDLASLPPEEMQRHGEGVGRFDAELTKAGQNLGSVRLGSGDRARVVRVRGGQIDATDGPFAESKEQLGGVYFVEAASFEEAEALAARIPMAEIGAIEVRECAGVDLRGKFSSWG